MRRSRNTASTRTRDNQTGLLLLSVSSAATMHSRATSARSKCGYTFNLQFRQKRAHTLSHVPCLIQLHWLPVRYKIQYKLCTLMHNIRSEKAPRYLCDIVQPTSARTICSGLRSSSAETTTSQLHTTLENRRGVVVTALVVSTKLLYVEPG